MGDTIKVRRGSTTQWETADPILASGEPGWDLTVNELRFGNGVDHWSDLTPLAGDGGGGLTTEDVQDVIGAFSSGGAGLTATYSDVGNTWSLAVNVDDSTVEISTDTLQLKDGGVTNAKVNASAAIALSKLAAITNNRFLGNVSGISAVPAEMTAAQAKTLLAVASTDLTDFTEAVQDVVGALGLGGSGLTMTYTDGSNTLTIDVNVDGSTLEISSDSLRIKDAGVTLAKLANIAAGTFLGNNTGGAAAPIALTASQTKSALAITGADVANTAAGNIAATTVQTAINELDTEKAALAGATFTGLVTASAGLAAPYVQNQQSGTSYTLVLTDEGKLVECSNASAITLTVPPNASVAFPTGAQITILQTGAGQVTLTPGAAVTINGTPGLKLTTQWSSATLIKRATNTWVAVGDLSS